jgi:hypothetical protein
VTKPAMDKAARFPVKYGRSWRQPGAQGGAK